MKNPPLVSIIILTYNHDYAILDSLDCVFSQNYPNYEVIIADDCSTDNTQTYLTNYKKENPDKKLKLVLNKKNLGITGNHNSALSYANGKYIIINGGDDQLLPGKIETQVQYLEKNHDCNFCYHNMEAFDVNTNKFLYYTHYDGKGKRKRDFGSAIDAIETGVFFSPVSVMFRRQNIPPNLFDKRIPNTSDWLFFVEMLIIGGGNAFYIDKVLGRYARSSNSNTVNRPPNHIIEIDLLNSCVILLLKYPEYSGAITRRLSHFIYRLRKFNPCQFLFYCFLSLKITFSFKPLISILIFFLTFGKVKK